MIFKILNLDVHIKISASRQIYIHKQYTLVEAASWPIMPYCPTHPKSPVAHFMGVVRSLGNSQLIWLKAAATKPLLDAIKVQAKCCCQRRSVLSSDSEYNNHMVSH